MMNYSVSFHAAVTCLGKTQGEAHPLTEIPVEWSLGDNLLGEQPRWGGGIAGSGIGGLGSVLALRLMVVCRRTREGAPWDLPPAGVPTQFVISEGLFRFKGF